MSVRADGTPFGEPILIFKGVNAQAKFIQGWPGAHLLMTDSGGMEGHGWAACAAVWADIAEGGEVFIVDGHQSHLDLTALDILRAHHVNVITLPPHTTHILQPLDTAFFRAWKAAFKRAVEKAMFRRLLNVGHIPELAKAAWQQVMPMQDGKYVPNKGITKAFASGGVYPPNRHAFPDSVFTPGDDAEVKEEAAMAAVRAALPPEEAVDKVLPLQLPGEAEMEETIKKGRQAQASRWKRQSRVLTHTEVYVRAGPSAGRPGRNRGQQISRCSREAEAGRKEGRSGRGGRRGG